MVNVSFSHGLCFNDAFTHLLFALDPINLFVFFFKCTPHHFRLLPPPPPLPSPLPPFPPSLLSKVSGVLIDEEGTTNGKIKVAYTMQVNTRALSPSTEQRHERSSQQQQHLRRVASQGDVAGDMSVMSGHSINSGLSGYASATHGASGAGANSRGRSLSPQRNQSASAALGFGKPPIGQQNRGPSAPYSPAVGSRGYQQQRPFSGMSSAPSETFGFSPVNSRPASASVNAAAARTAAAFGAAVQNNPNANAFRGAGAGGAPGGSRFPSAAASHHGAHGPHGPSFVSALGMLGATSYDEDEDEDPRRHVEFPFNVTVLEISAVDLAKVHTLSKNQPYIRAFCDEFYSETEVRTLCGSILDIQFLLFSLSFIVEI